MTRMNVMENFELSAGMSTGLSMVLRNAIDSSLWRTLWNRQVAINNRFILTATCFGSIWPSSGSCQEYKDKLTIWCKTYVISTSHSTTTPQCWTNSVGICRHKNKLRFLGPLACCNGLLLKSERIYSQHRTRCINPSFCWEFHNKVPGLIDLFNDAFTSLGYVHTLNDRKTGK